MFACKPGLLLDRPEAFQKVKTAEREAFDLQLPASVVHRVHTAHQHWDTERPASYVTVLRCLRNKLAWGPSVSSPLRSTWVQLAPMVRHVADPCRSNNGGTAVGTVPSDKPPVLKTTHCNQARLNESQSSAGHHEEKQVLHHMFTKPKGPKGTHSIDTPASVELGCETGFPAWDAAWLHRARS